ncbi:hypothetical protein GCM10011575_32720 [Microlunatus endophyticus]|uniref:Uncharacterized protein n=1 Tax=Microlunatus endophyticus TaxID=1716077 RepID=A0A917W5R5_9ACTN|nr:hypothetical protein GCM10011575_32720 [Microlunatus endophyticus]
MKINFAGFVLLGAEDSALLEADLLDFGWLAVGDGAAGGAGDRVPATDGPAVSCGSAEPLWSGMTPQPTRAALIAVAAIGSSSLRRAGMAVTASPCVGEVETAQR